VRICLPPLPILTAVVPREITLGLFVALVATTSHVARRPGCDIVSEYRARPLLARYFGRKFVDNTGVRLVEAKLNELRPTQMTVGYDEVAFKRRNWNALTSEERSHFVCEHIFPAVLGPNGNYYILDGHHLGRALLEEGVDNVLILPVEDLSHLDQGSFWRVMERRNLIYPYAQGQRHNFEDMPKTLRELADDPFRSLTARIHRACQYAKDPTPFAEFQSADFLRNHISCSALRAYPGRAFRYARKLLRNRASTDGREGTVSIRSGRIGPPRCYDSHDHVTSAI
jgi:hypothetical protein